MTMTVLALLLAGSMTDTRSTVALADVAETELVGVKPDKLTKALRERLRKDDRFTPAPEGASAAYELEVLRCYRVVLPTSALEARQGDIQGVSGTKRARGGSQEMAVTTGSQAHYELAVRLTWKDRFLEVTSAPEDRSLEDAIDTVVRRLHKADPPDR